MLCGVFRAEQFFATFLPLSTLLSLFLPRPRNRCMTSRHGESMFNTQGLIGGNPPLSPLGEEYAKVLVDFVRDSEELAADEVGMPLMLRPRRLRLPPLLLPPLLLTSCWPQQPSLFVVCLIVVAVVVVVVIALVCSLLCCCCC